MQTDRFYPIVALALLAAVTIWLERTTRTPDTTERIARTNPDFIGSNVRVTSFDADGRLSYELDAVRMTHYPQSGITDLEQPYLRHHGDTGQTTVRALRGETAPDADVVDLHGEVIVRRSNPNGEDTIITTEHLTVWPDSQRAASDSPVIIKQGNITASGDGMRADSLAGTLDLVGATRVEMPSSKRTRP